MPINDRPQPPTIVTTMSSLAGAHATARPANGGTGHVAATIGTPDVAVVMIDEPAVIRDLLCDLVAQLEAIEAQT